MSLIRIRQALILFGISSIVYSLTQFTLTDLSYDNNEDAYFYAIMGALIVISNGFSNRHERHKQRTASQ